MRSLALCMTAFSVRPVVTAGRSTYEPVCRCDPDRCWRQISSPLLKSAAHCPAVILRVTTNLSRQGLDPLLQCHKGSDPTQM